MYPTGMCLAQKKSDGQESSGHKQPFVSRAGRLESIQALRAVAAVGVVFTHAITRISTVFPDTSDHSLFAGTGALTVGDAGVDLFFVISGFIILYVHRYDFGQSGAPPKFIVKRLLRVVPIYWFLTTIAVGILIFAPQLFRTHYSGIHLPWIIGSYLFLPVAPPGGIVSPVIGVGWTLNYEMFFYAVFAGALLLRKRLGLQLICLCFGSLVALGTLLKPSNPLLNFVTNWLLLDFLMGVAIAWWVLTKGKLSRAPRYILFSIGVVCLTATIVWTPPEEGPLRFLLWGIPTALIVFATSSANESERSLGRVTAVLGDASYSIYLFQFFALPAWAQAMRAVGAEALAFDANVLILTVLVTASGVGCWFLLERPLNRLARNFLEVRAFRLYYRRTATDG
jgi:peptidoglycan/LPS O-acetylase OafA/YrhL